MPNSINKLVITSLFLSTSLAAVAESNLVSELLETVRSANSLAQSGSNFVHDISTKGNIIGYAEVNQIAENQTISVDDGILSQNTLVVDDSRVLYLDVEQLSQLGHVTVSSNGALLINGIEVTDSFIGALSVTQKAKIDFISVTNGGVVVANRAVF